MEWCRFTGTIIWVVFVTVSCIVVQDICGADSLECRATWWNTTRYRDVAFKNADHAKGCFNYAFRGETMFGDSVESWSSLYFALPMFYIREMNAWFVFITMWTAITSFIFHATYAHTPHAYDILGVRVFAVSIVIDYVMRWFVYTKSSFWMLKENQGTSTGDKFRWLYYRTFAFLLRGMLLLALGYIGYRMWENGYKGDSKYFRSRTWTYVWSGTSSSVFGMLVMYGIIRKDPIFINDWKRIVGLVVCFVIGLIMLIMNNDECTEHSQMRGKHFYGHLFIGIGACILASMDIWRMDQSGNGEYELVNRKNKDLLHTKGWHFDNEDIFMKS